MLGVHLEDAFRAQLAEREVSVPQEVLGFALDFARLLVQVAPPRSGTGTQGTIRGAIRARCGLDEEVLDLLIELVWSPEARTAIDEQELRAFGARFGEAEEEALRSAVAEEVTLEGFATRYGPEEALLLLDALFAVCAVDGVIDRTEIGRLQQSAVQLGVDDMLVSALFQKHDVRHASGDFEFDLDGDRFHIGRSPGCAIQLPDPQVAVRHAELMRTSSGWRIRDAGSGRPTLLNNSPVTSAPFRHGDRVRVGPYTLVLDKAETSLTAFGMQSFSALSVRDLHRRIGEIVLLDGVHFTVFSGEVIALVGPSGAGKTTLLNAIAGIAPADSGDVLLDGQDFHQLLGQDRTFVGMVPQEDVVHAELQVKEALAYAGRLRLPPDVDGKTIDGQVDRVLRELGIDHIATSRIGDQVRRGVSGGQRKRVNLGQELLTQTTRVLFLDEPTSGLDPQTAQDIVSLVRQLADEGRIIFLVTHDVTPSVMSMVDHLMVLAPGGRLAWFGPPNQACAHFGVDSPDRIFARIPDATPTEWAKRYRESTARRTYVATREHLLGLEDSAGTTGDARRQTRLSPWRSFTTLTRRYAKVKLRDTTGTLVLLSQAPILGIAMVLAFPKADVATMFMLALSSLWFGASDGVRELISERAIWRREARVGLSVLPYIASKVTVLGVFVAVQCAVLASMNWLFLDMGAFGFSLPALAGVCTLTGLVGVSLGLLMSAMFSSSEAAIGTLPLLLIPQIAFGGLIVKVKHMGAAALAISYLMVTRFSFEMAIKTGETLSIPAARRGQEAEEHIRSPLWDLGFRGTDSADMGIEMSVLAGILLLFFTVFMAATTWLTARSARGN